VRVGCVCVFVGIAYLVPNINDLATLVGGMMSPMLGFIFPPLFYMKLFKGKLAWCVARAWCVCKRVCVRVVVCVCVLAFEWVYVGVSVCGAVGIAY
jgi:hypothetical protein